MIIRHEVSFILYQLQEVWACWCELLSYLEQEDIWMDLLEQKLNEMVNIHGGADKMAEAVAVSSWTYKPIF